MMSEWILCECVIDVWNVYVSTEFIVEYEESQWEPENWRELQRVPGNQVTEALTLHGHLDYQFRMYAVNAIGRGSPSKPTERYKTFPAGQTLTHYSMLLAIYYDYVIDGSSPLPKPTLNRVSINILYCCLFIPTAPDKNPENIKIQGHMPHQMDISWEVS